MPDEKTYKINLGKAHVRPRTRRAKTAINMIKQFLSKHTKTPEENVKIGKELNQEIWKRGAEKPPRKITVNTLKTKQQLLANLVGTKLAPIEQKPGEKPKETKKPEKEETEKKEETKKPETQKEPEKQTKKPEEKKPETKTTEKKAEKTQKKPEEKKQTKPEKTEQKAPKKEKKQKEKTQNKASPKKVNK